MKKKILCHASAFGHAFDGLSWAFNTQPNYHIHLLLTFITVVAGFILSISYFEWLIIILLITLGLVIEAINTAIEVTTDAITKEWKEEIRIAKDVSAAAMLVYAVGASILAIIIFIPKILFIVSN